MMRSYLRMMLFALGLLAGVQIPGLVDLYFQRLDARLQQSAQLGGATPCATDIALFPFVRQFAAVEPTWFDALPLPALQGWLRGWLAHELFNQAMAKLEANRVVAFAG